MAERLGSKEDSEPHGHVEVPFKRPSGAGSGKASGEARTQDTSARGNRHGSQHGGSQKGPDRSPIHPQAYAGRPNQSLEKKGPTEGGATPGRSRLGGKPKDEVGEKTALPVFGAWDAMDPASADGFTVIFNKAKDEKMTGRAPVRPQSPSGKDGDLYKPSDGEGANGKWFCCFRSTTADH